MLRKPLGSAIWLQLLGAFLGGLCVLHLAIWVTDYLTWPWWADHDVFSTMAHGWDAGQLPYRELYGNNFPGTIYLFWAVGKVFGWGRTSAYNALDALLLILLGIALLVWSRRRLGRVLPGLVGYTAILSYYLSLDFSQLAQRDWHAALLVVLGLLAVQIWPNRAGRIMAAGALASGFSIRPQVLLLLPAVVLAVWHSAAGPETPRRQTVRALLELALGLGGFVALAFLPLVLAGVFDDFLRGVRTVAPGSGYSELDAGSFLRAFLEQLKPLRLWAVLVPLLLPALWADRGIRRIAATWGVGLLWVLLYYPLSPVPRPYSAHPYWLVWSVSLAMVVHLFISARSLAPALKLAAVLVVLALGATVWPRHVAPERALQVLRGQTGDPPSSYRHPYVDAVALYPWDDYRAVLGHLRRTTGAKTRIANVLKGIAVTGPTGRLSAFPAESATWLFVVDPTDEERFATALERASDSVVVWAPLQQGPSWPGRFARLEQVIRSYYQPETSFGMIEVWRRKPIPPVG